ncbi:MAG TPA: ASCH domain-containing protein [Armatimonadota bacterium]
MFALNFYSEVYGEMLRNGHKTATIRLGDKSRKYQSGQLVWITLGRRHGVRLKLFTAVLDSVVVKRAGELSPRELERESPELRSLEDLLVQLERLYGRPVTELDTVTMIQFSRVQE